MNHIIAYNYSTLEKIISKWLLSSQFSLFAVAVKASGWEKHCKSGTKMWQKKLNQFVDNGLFHLTRVATPLWLTKLFAYPRTKIIGWLKLLMTWMDLSCVLLQIWATFYCLVSDLTATAMCFVCEPFSSPVWGVAYSLVLYIAVLKDLKYMINIQSHGFWYNLGTTALEPRWFSMINSMVSGAIWD